MLVSLLQIQPLIVALMLILGAIGKAADRSTLNQGPAALLPNALQRPFGATAIVVEAALAIALLVFSGPVGAGARAAAAVVFAGSAVSLVVLRRRDPGMGCGCFGGLSTTPIGRRTIGRAALLAVAAAVSIGVPGSGLTVLGDLSWPQTVFGLVESAVIAALSPEIKEAIMRTMGREPCEVRPVPVGRSLARLHASEVWRTHSVKFTAPEPVDTWRHACHRMFRFTGHRYDRPVDVVFAVELRGLRPNVRAAVIDADDGATQTVLGEVALSDAVPLPRTKHGAPHATGTVVPHSAAELPLRPSPDEAPS